MTFGEFKELKDRVTVLKGLVFQREQTTGIDPAIKSIAILLDKLVEYLGEVDDSASCAERDASDALRKT